MPPFEVETPADVEIDYGEYSEEECAEIDFDVEAEHPIYGSFDIEGEADYYQRDDGNPEPHDPF